MSGSWRHRLAGPRSAGSGGNESGDGKRAAKGSAGGENSRRRESRGIARERRNGAHGKSGDAAGRPPGPPPRPPRSVPAAGARRSSGGIRAAPRPAARPLFGAANPRPPSPRPPIASGGRAVRSAPPPLPPPHLPPPRPVRADITALPGGAGPGGRARPPPRAERVVVERRRRVPHRASPPVRTGPPAWWTSSCRGRSRAPWGSPPRVSAGAGGPRGAAVPSGGRRADSAGKGPAGGCGLSAGHGSAASPRRPSGRPAAALPAPAPSFPLASFFRSLLLFPRFGFLFLFLFPFSFLSFSFCSSVFVWGYFSLSLPDVSFPFSFVPFPALILSFRFFPFALLSRSVVPSSVLLRSSLLSAFPPFCIGLSAVLLLFPLPRSHFSVSFWADFPRFPPVNFLLGIPTAPSSPVAALFFRSPFPSVFLSFSLSILLKKKKTTKQNQNPKQTQPKTRTPKRTKPRSPQPPPAAR